MRSVWLILCLIGAPSIGEACSCVHNPVAAEFERSSAVFEATVLSVDARDELVRVRVRTVWKTDGAELKSIANAPLTDPCAYPFAEGRSYIVFAQRYRSFWSFLPWMKDELWTSVCTLTTPSSVPGEWEGSESYARRLAEIRNFLERAR